MNFISKKKSEHTNLWDLQVKGHTIGHVEVIFLSETTRSCKGEISAMTVDGKCIEYGYDGTQTKKPFSIAQFIDQAEEALGEHELVLTDSDEFEEEDTGFEKVVLIRDITEENVDDMAVHMGEQVSGTKAQKVQQLQDILRAEKIKAQKYPMFNLVRLSRMRNSKPTALKYHCEKHIG